MTKSPHILFYIIPYMVWLYLIKGFYDQGQLNLVMDAKDCYLYTNYFLNHIVRGVYPFWNPFDSWGRPDDLLARMIGEFNPFLYLIVLFKKAGLGFTQAYFGYLIIYYSLGIIGISLLARQLFQSSFITWMVFNLALFSNLSSNLFNNILVILMLVPSVWFFFFLARFTQKPQKSSLLGLTFCLMIIVTTYMPFHFLVIFFSFLAFYLCVYVRDLMSILQRCWSFVFQNKMFTLFCLISLLVASIPGLLWYQLSLKGDFVASWRGDHNSIYVDKEVVDKGSIISQHVLKNPVSNLQDYSSEVFYFPFIVILIALMSIILPFNRIRVLFFFLAIFIFLLCLTMATPLYSFLFQHVFFFKLIRNVHFLIWAFGVIMILLAADLFCAFINLKTDTQQQRIKLCVFVVLIHLMCLIALMQFWSVIASTYVTIFISCLFLVLYFSGIIRRDGFLFYALITIAILAQPFEVLKYVQRNALPFQFPYSLKPYTEEQSKPKFLYVRPSIKEDQAMINTRNFGEISDRSGFPEFYWQYQGTRWSYGLIRNFPFKDSLEQYVRHKFVLYDPQKNINSGLLDNNPPGVFIDQDSSEFQVSSFDMNDIKLKTNFNEKKLLVYNDNYYEGWQAFINGQQVPIVRANTSFKGIYLPAGENQIMLRFHSPAYRLFFLFLIFYFQAILIILMVLSFKRNDDAKSFKIS